jgi:CheY-like chemotaxis protein
LVVDKSDSAEIPLILVVDDDDSVRRLLTTFLGSHGYEIEQACDGRAGIEAVQRRLPRLIVLDHYMPGMDGGTFLVELDRLVVRRPPVILFTAAAHDQGTARRLGADVFVEKPVDLSRFLKLVDTMVRSAPHGMLATERTPGRERRGYRRLAHRRPIEVRLPSRTGIVPATLVDVCEGGMAFEGVHDVEPTPNGYVSILINDGAQRVEIDARVRYVGPGRVGVQFFALNDAVRAAIGALLDQARAED